MTSQDARRGLASVIRGLRSQVLAAATTAAVGAILAGVGLVASWVWPPLIDSGWAYASRQLGIAALAAEVAKLTDRVAVLEPVEPVVVYDPSLSYVDGDACTIGGPCVAVFRVRRTPTGGGCDAPLVAPLVQNHAGREHSAELLQPITAEADDGSTEAGVGQTGVRAAQAWTRVRLVFRVPANVQPGRAVYFSRLTNVCGGARQPPVDSLRLPFVALPPSDESESE